MTTRWLWNVGLLMLVAAVSPRPALAQGDGPRTHWKEMLTDTNVFSLTNIHASGNVNPNDPASRIVPGANFDGDLTLVGYSRSFSLHGRTAVGTILVPVGQLEGEFAGPLSSSTRGFGDPILQLGLNLIGTPAMPNIPALMRYEPDYTVDLVLDLAFPIGEYDEDSPTNIGQNRWYGRVGVPVMINLCDWVPGRKTKRECFPAVWYQGAESTIAGLSGGELNDVGVGFTLGYKINDNLMMTAGYTVTIDDGPADLDLGAFRINLIYGWHQLFEGMDRLKSAEAM